jgi:hypothetical protein
LVIFAHLGGHGRGLQEPLRLPQNFVKNQKTTSVTTMKHSLLNKPLESKMNSGFSLFSLPLSLALVLGGSGCSSTSGPGSASFASVTIQNHSAQEIVQATAQVFAADGWRGGTGPQGELIFEKEASRATTLSREGFVGTYYGAQTMNRVRAQLVSLGTAGFRLQCKAFLVTGGSDPFFQEEKPLTNIRSAPYQSLLNKVAEQLK